MDDPAADGLHGATDPRIAARRGVARPSSSAAAAAPAAAASGPGPFDDPLAQVRGETEPIRLAPPRRWSIWSTS